MWVHVLQIFLDLPHFSAPWEKGSGNFFWTALTFAISLCFFGILVAVGSAFSTRWIPHFFKYVVSFASVASVIPSPISTGRFTETFLGVGIFLVYVGFLCLGGNWGSGYGDNGNTIVFVIAIYCCAVGVFNMILHCVDDASALSEPLLN